MIADLPGGLVARHPVPDDHPRVLAVLDEWWADLKGDDGARERALLLPRLYFQHFTTTSFVVEDEGGRLAAFLIGFLSQTEPDTAYIHFVGVDPRRQGQGVGRALYRAFLDVAAANGRTVVQSVTSPENAGSQAFHRRLGFSASEVIPDYDGPGLARVAFRTTTTAAPARGARGLRVLDGALVLERVDGVEAPAGDWVALVRAPDGLTAIRPAPGTGAQERWIALYEAEPDHGLDEPGLLVAVLTPLARSGVPVFVASTYDADLVLVPEERAQTALAALRASGFAIS
ncbi:GNAT family N-acetyltransferase [Microbacterium sp. p3-SID336]|uniref:GNAT family N-acetyltransferase n=1 Tax=Microbacterium sp. p3-SID336 TaxID=2916212 RepID=UPI0021A820D1|nr:GNAT family N-acetyltransferase [Microbacterium sp. p3-SID336]MCT1479107.1 GNAT family N-acetyltransferase [Microbacterium sp. p3-SID336]